MCFDAGFDGFWLARFLLDRGIPTLVLDPSSFLVSRRGRRAKTHRFDVEAMVFTLKAFSRGDRSVCRPVRMPTPDDNTARPHSEAGYLNPAAYAANFAETHDPLRSSDRLRRSSVAPTALQCV